MVDGQPKDIEIIEGSYLTYFRGSLIFVDTPSASYVTDEVKPVNGFEFGEWCEERGIGLEQIREADHATVYRVVIPNDDAAFEFKMRWDLG